MYKSFEVNQPRYSREIQEYKNFAAARRKRRKYTQELMTFYYDKLGEYITKRWEEKKPLTISGVWLALGVNKDFWSKAKNGEYDYLLEEYLDIHNVDEDNTTFIDDMPFHMAEDGPVLLISYSDFIEKANYLIQNQLEEGIYSGRGNPAGFIFGLKNIAGWRDDSDQPQHVVNQLVIADSEQAKKAMAMLTNG